MSGQALLEAENSLAQGESGELPSADSQQLAALAGGGAKGAGGGAPPAPPSPRSVAFLLPARKGGRCGDSLPNPKPKSSSPSLWKEPLGAAVGN